MIELKNEKKDDISSGETQDQPSYSKLSNESFEDGDIEASNKGILSESQPEKTNKNNVTFFSWLWATMMEEEKDDEVMNIPDLSYFQLFCLFLGFGIRAFGGPVAQIALMKHELITQQKWMSDSRFTRVYGVYQIVPGPEAFELACYFGYLVKGRIGCVLGGTGFLLPGFGLMLLSSYLYTVYGVNRQVQRSFQCLQCVVSATIFKATYKLADSTLKDAKTKEFSWIRGGYVAFAFLTSTIGLNFFITLGMVGVMNLIWEQEETQAIRSLREKFLPVQITLIHTKYFIISLFGAGTLAFYAMWVSMNGIPQSSLIGASGSSSINGTSYRDLLALGIVAGCVSFGGAYTTFPFIYSAAVQGGQWLTAEQFLAAVAIVNILPTPLVTFVTLVGYIGNGIGGAILITIGIFLPSYFFPFVGHHFFEKMVQNKFVNPFLEGIGAGVIGFVLQTAFTFVRQVINEPIDVISFLLAYWALFHFTDRNTPLYCMLTGAIAGQTLYL